MQRLFVSTSLKRPWWWLQEKEILERFHKSTNLGIRTYCPERNYGVLHKKYKYSSYTGCWLSSAPTLTYKCIKPHSSIQYLEHKREFGEPDLCLLNQTMILHWITSELDDSNMKIGQLACLERLFQKLWHLLDRQSSIDLRPSLMTSIWRLLCSLQTPFNVTGLPNRQCSSIHFPLHRSGNYAWSSLPLILSLFS